MKIQFKNIITTLCIGATFIACTKNDADITPKTDEKGGVSIKFDNIFGAENFVLDKEYTLTNNEKIKANKVKYIVSNIELTNQDGTVFTYPKSDSYFIIDEQIATMQKINLTNVPVGTYTKIKFGIGVDKAQWALGAAGQGDFLTKADQAGMLWNWTAGYKFLAFEGTFTTPTTTDTKQFKVHTGKTMVNGTENYNYTEITLPLPDKALCSTKITPSVHVMIDLSKILDGLNKINLANGASIMGGEKVGQITKNLDNMFIVDHVHND